MIIESLAIFWFLIILVFVLVGLLAAAFWLIHNLSKKVFQAQRREERLKASLEEKEAAVIVEAERHARQIVAKAIREAAKIEGAAAANQQELKELFERRLRRELEKVQKDDINVFKSVSKDIEKDARQAMLTEIEKQKEERLKKLDGEIVGLVEAVVEKVLGRVLSLETHEELIFEALEKAKKERIFR